MGGREEGGGERRERKERGGRGREEGGGERMERKERREGERGGRGRLGVASLQMVSLVALLSSPYAPPNLALFPGLPHFFSLQFAVQYNTRFRVLY